MPGGFCPKYIPTSSGSKAGVTVAAGVFVMAGVFGLAGGFV
jgi:hypothetical protein